MNELIMPRELVSSSITAESQSMSLRNTCLSLARVQKKQTAIPLALREYPSVEWWHRNGVEFLTHSGSGNGVGNAVLHSELSIGMAPLPVN